MRREFDPGSSLIHLIGTGLSVAALVIMLVIAANSGAAAVVGAAIFGSSLVLLYLMSTLFHFMSKGSKAREVFRRLDHSMIYVLIAGTYTPITLVVLPPVWGWTVFGVIWGLAIIGITLKSCGLMRSEKHSLPLYIVMGWLVLVALWPLSKILSVWGWFWIATGGVLYTAGTFFYAMSDKWAWSRWLGAHEVWHIFVLLGSVCHFFFMIFFVF